MASKKPAPRTPPQTPNPKPTASEKRGISHKGIAQDESIFYAKPTTAPKPPTPKKK